MSDEAKRERGRPARDLSEKIIRNAMKHTQSNRQAARYLNMTILTYRKYASMYVDKETGKTLYELHSNRHGRGMKKISWRNEITTEKLEEIVNKGIYRAVNPQKLKARLIYEGMLRMECYQCGFSEKRVIDYKQPLILNFKDGNKNNWKLDNLRMLCYNCYYLYVGNLFTDKQMKAFEDSGAPLVKDMPTFDIEDDILAYFNDVGTEKLEDEEDYEPGDEYIAKL